MDGILSTAIFETESIGNAYLTADHVITTEDMTLSESWSEIDLEEPSYRICIMHANSIYLKYNDLVARSCYTPILAPGVSSASIWLYLANNASSSDIGTIIFNTATSGKIMLRANNKSLQITCTYTIFIYK